MTTAPRVESVPPPFDWQRWPETEAFLAERVRSALEHNPFAADLARRMAAETSTRIIDWVDHLVLAERPGLVEELGGLGYAVADDAYGVSEPSFRHPGGQFPAVAVARRPGGGPEVAAMALKVESIAAFSGANDLGLEPVGYPMGPYRFAKVEVAGAGTALLVVERRGYLGFEPFPSSWARLGRMAPHAARDAMAARELWQGRRRRFGEDEEGFDAVDAVLARVIERAGSTDLACHLVFEVERDYWESRNAAATVQKRRQDRLGLGWANHDHHTFRCSRQFFPRTIGIFERLGFTLRESFHAGKEAGWGAQVLEHPTTGIVIFADLDLAPEEAEDDFAHGFLPGLDRPNTVGLWVGLHGESLLDAGMHHLEAQFDFDALGDDLRAEADIETMAPFSDFPFLRQAFTRGERWPVPVHRADRLLRFGWIDAAQHAKFLAEGAIGSHLENLQRGEGFKGFNQKAVSAIIAETDPRRH
ncbi:hypothetical protein [Tautonia plasticadhaerens]|uniref:Uncharacterized protein n=1 Tax=Tautonia plasticadhaerens TaxID=2527974 RepID=A0A518H898_9BACT|nr:hypothetical protein [Tautonia plasticadhaerens]QDV37079.1 hypothetical protein ElP_50120 [Tautonia plasticadhaerens]